MSRTIKPSLVWEQAAKDLYPALPETEKETLWLEDFAEEIKHLLIDSGDLDEYGQSATGQGETHGLKNTLGHGWNLDDNGEETANFYFDFAVANKEGNEYIKNLVKSEYPDFDEEVYRKHMWQKELDSRLSMARGHIYRGFEDLPKEVLDLLKDIVLNEIQNYIIYIQCDYEDENSLLKAIKAYQYVYRSNVDLTVMSGEQIAINYKYDLLRGEKHTLCNHLVRPYKNREFFVIDRIEDIVKDDRAQLFLEETIEEAKKHNVRILILSDKAPEWIYGLSDKLQEKLKEAELFYVCQACRDYKYIAERADDMLNKVELAGRMVDDPVMKYTQKGTRYCEFILAVDREPDGDCTDFVECTAWRDMADKICREFEKNQLVYLVGRLQSYTRWDKEDKAHTSWEVVVDQAYIGGGKNRSRRTAPPDWD